MEKNAKNVLRLKFFKILEQKCNNSSNIFSKNFYSTRAVLLFLAMNLKPQILKKIT